MIKKTIVRKYNSKKKTRKSNLRKRRSQSGCGRGQGQGSRSRRNTIRFPGPGPESEHGPGPGDRRSTRYLSGAHSINPGSFVSSRINMFAKQTGQPNVHNVRRGTLFSGQSPGRRKTVFEQLSEAHAKEIGTDGLHPNLFNSKRTSAEKTFALSFGPVASSAIESFGNSPSLPRTGSTSSTGSIRLGNKPGNSSTNASPSVENTGRFKAAAIKAIQAQQAQQAQKARPSFAQVVPAAVKKSKDTSTALQQHLQSILTNREAQTPSLSKILGKPTTLKSTLASLGRRVSGALRRTSSTSSNTSTNTSKNRIAELESIVSKLKASDKVNSKDSEAVAGLIKHLHDTGSINPIRVHSGEDVSAENITTAAQAFHHLTQRDKVHPSKYDFEVVLKYKDAKPEKLAALMAMDYTKRMHFPENIVQNFSVDSIKTLANLSNPVFLKNMAGLDNASLQRLSGLNTETLRKFSVLDTESLGKLSGLDAETLNKLSGLDTESLGKFSGLDAETLKNTNIDVLKKLNVLDYDTLNNFQKEGKLKQLGMLKGEFLENLSYDKLAAITLMPENVLTKFNELTTQQIENFKPNILKQIASLQPELINEKIISLLKLVPKLKGNINSSAYETVFSEFLKKDIQDTDENIVKFIGAVKIEKDLSNNLGEVYPVIKAPPRPARPGKQPSSNAPISANELRALHNAARARLARKAAQNAEQKAREEQKELKLAIEQQELRADEEQAGKLASAELAESARIKAIQNARNARHAIQSRSSEENFFNFNYTASK